MEPSGDRDRGVGERFDHCKAGMGKLERLAGFEHHVAAAVLLGDPDTAGMCAHRATLNVAQRHRLPAVEQENLHSTLFSAQGLARQTCGQAHSTPSATSPYGSPGLISSTVSTLSVSVLSLMPTRIERAGIAPISERCRFRYKRSFRRASARARARRRARATAPAS